MSIKRMFESARNSGVRSDSCHDQKRLQITIFPHTDFATAGRE